MSSIKFRDRRHHEIMDADFTLWDGDRLGDLSGYQIGDHVGVCFDNLQKQQTAIHQNCPKDFDGYFGGDAGFVQVRCVVVSRSHSMVWKSVGVFQELMRCNVILEAESGYWEDVLKWIIIGEKPDWIPDDWETQPW